MHVIYKYPLTERRTAIELPFGAKVLSCQEQDDIPTMWVLVDTALMLKPRTFRIIATGEPIEPILPHIDYVGTCLINGGSTILHIFEEI